MATWNDGRSGQRLAGAAGAIAAQLVLAALLLWGLAFQGEPGAPGEALDAVTVVDLPPPEPPRPSPEPAAGEPAASPEGAARPAPPEAPRPRPPLPFPVPPAPAAEAVAGDAGATGDEGVGPGAGGAGTGDGSGNGDGGGIATPAQRISGALRDSDYPREAARQGLEGTVGISFRVRTDGRVDGCNVVRSSGHELLDRLTCRLFTERFRFRPAMTAGGEPVQSTLRTSFTWGTRRR